MSNLTKEEFMNKKVKVIFEPLISNLIVEKPSNPVNIKF